MSRGHGQLHSPNCHHPHHALAHISKFLWRSSPLLNDAQDRRMSTTEDIGAPALHEQVEDQQLQNNDTQDRQSSETKDFGEYSLREQVLDLQFQMRRLKVCYSMRLLYWARLIARRTHSPRTTPDLQSLRVKSTHSGNPTGPQLTVLKATMMPGRQEMIM